MKMDELIARLGITVRYGPAYSPWFNGINERNHARFDITIKKLMEEKKVMLNDTLVKAASWAHNTNINKLGYLQRVTGKSCNLPGLILGSEASQSVSDTEAVQKVMERILKTTAEFREADMWMKLKDCQGVRVRQYQHQGPYILGDRDWYRHQDSNAWLSPAIVFCHKENIVCVHKNGDDRKVSISKVKPYELIP